MQRRSFLAVAAVGMTAAVARAQSTHAPATTRDDILALETAFARTLAERDFAAFARFIDEEAQFLNGGRPLRGREEILAFWQKQFEAPDAPFSWAPDQALLLPSGELAQTEGPVRDPAGTVFSRFYSVWRRNAAGDWKIVFDNGYAVCG